VTLAPPTAHPTGQRDAHRGEAAYPRRMDDPFVTDHEVLLQQYADGRSLDARANLYAWQEPRHDLVATVLSYIPLDTRLVLDVGCGRGQYLAGLRGMQHVGIGVELSPGLAVEATTRTHQPTLVGDALALPIGDGTVDAALALHLLNHLSDPERGLAECRRVTRAGGAVIVLTNSDEHIAEHRALAGEAAGLDHPLTSTDRSFSDDLALVESVLGPVEVVHLDGTISVDRPEPLVDYARSAEEFYELQIDLPWDEFMDRFERLVIDRIARDGSVEITARTTVFIATVD
jgi:SAM-dependent methyltransferase